MREMTLAHPVSSVSALFLAMVLLLASSPVAAQANSGYLAGNKTVTLQVCDGTNGTSPLRRYITFHGYGSAASMTVNGVSALPFTGGITADLPAGQSCMDVTVVTSGVPSNTFPTTASSIRFLGCIVYPPPAGVTCSSGTGGMGFRQYEFVYPVVGPVATLSPATVSIEGSTPVTVTLSPPLAATTVGSSQPCSLANGVQANVSQPSLQTNISGKAIFTVNTPVLHVPAPPGTPSGSCLFSLPAYPGVSATLPLQASTMPLGISLSTYLIGLAGITSVQVNIFPVHSVARVTVDASCNSTIAQVHPTQPSSVQSDALGHATIGISASGLVNVNPNTNIVPSAQCTFNIRNTTTSANVAFTTANACAFADLQPRPATCGNPPN